MNCPRCGFDNHDFAIECERCGVVFSKLQTPHPRLADPLPASVVRENPVPRPAERGEHGRRPGEGRPPWKILVFGFIGALLAHAFWPTAAALGALQTLFHESGHAVVAWLLGHPSIPAFDFVFGGGVTSYGDFHLSIALLIAVAFGYLAWRLRTRQALVAVTAAVFLAWLIIVTSQWRRETVMASAGVIFELLLGAAFLYMTIANVGWRIPEIERPLGALVAFFALFKSWIFTMGLINNREVLDAYMRGKGGAMMNDLEVVALNLKIYLGMNATVQGLAKLLLVFSIVPYALAFWLASRHDEVQQKFATLLSEVS